MSDIVLAEIEDEGEVRLLPFQASRGQLEVRGLGYRYGEGEPDIFRELDLTFAPGESVAIVGPSGSAKTTLLKVLAGLMQPTSGEMFVDGAPLQAVGLVIYRKLVGCVLQDDRLFSGSIAENISAFDPTPDPSSAW